MLHREHPGLGLGHELRTLLGVHELLSFEKELLHEVRESIGLFNLALETLSALCLDEAVGIVLGRQDDEARLLHVRDDGRGRLKRTTRSLAAGGVAVEREVDAVGELEELPDMLGRDRRTECGDGLLEPGLRKLDHVHVALADDGAALAVDRLPAFEIAVELAALVVDRRFGTVEVLGLLVAVHRAGAETDHKPLGVADREHDAPSERIVAPVVPDVDETALLKRPVGILLSEKGLKGMPVVGRIAETELRGRGGRNTAVLEIIGGSCVPPELLRVKGRGLSHVVRERARLLAGLDLCGRAVLGNPNSREIARDFF